MQSILPGCGAAEPGAGIALPRHACSVGLLEAKTLLLFDAAWPEPLTGNGQLENALRLPQRHEAARIIVLPDRPHLR